MRFSAGEPAPGYISLFNGIDLSGRTVPAGNNGRWKVGGVIAYDALSEAEGDKSLWSRSGHGDFVLCLDWRIKETPYRNPRVPIVLPNGSHKRDADGRTGVAPAPGSRSGGGELKDSRTITEDPAGRGLEKTAYARPRPPPGNATTDRTRRHFPQVSG